MFSSLSVSSGPDAVIAKLRMRSSCCRTESRSETGGRVPLWDGVAKVGVVVRVVLRGLLIGVKSLSIEGKGLSRSSSSREAKGGATDDVEAVDGDGVKRNEPAVSTLAVVLSWLSGEAPNMKEGGTEVPLNVNEVEGVGDVDVSDLKPLEMAPVELGARNVGCDVEPDGFGIAKLNVVDDGVNIGAVPVELVESSVVRSQVVLRGGGFSENYHQRYLLQPY